MTPASESFLVNFIKKRLSHRCFPVNIAKILEASIWKNICERLLLPLQLRVSRVSRVAWSRVDFKHSFKTSYLTCVVWLIILLFSSKLTFFEKLSWIFPDSFFGNLIIYFDTRPILMFKIRKTSINPFQAIVLFLKFSDVFRRYRKGTLAWNGLTGI